MQNINLVSISIWEVCFIAINMSNRELEKLIKLIGSLFLLLVRILFLIKIRDSKFNLFKFWLDLKLLLWDILTKNLYYYL